MVRTKLEVPGSNPGQGFFISVSGPFFLSKFYFIHMTARRIATA